MGLHLLDKLPLVDYMAHTDNMVLMVCSVYNTPVHFQEDIPVYARVSVPAHWVHFRVFVPVQFAGRWAVKH
jgi:hypothetical protein